MKKDNANTEEIKRRLEAEKKEIEEELAKFKETLDFGDESDHLEEESDESEEMGTYLGVKKTQDARLGAINRALEKIQSGTYGSCERCGKPIEQEILDIDPESALCKSCKHNERH